MKKELRVFIIEDMPADYELICRELDRGGLQAHCLPVTSTQEFMNHVSTDPPDLILSDHGVPGFDGLTALKLAKVHCPEVPFIFVSGAPDWHSQSAAEADGCISKNRLFELAPLAKQAISTAVSRSEVRALESAAQTGREEINELYAIMESASSRLGLSARHLETELAGLDRALGPSTSDRTRKHVNGIGSIARDVSLLAGRLAEFARIGSMPMHLVEFELADLVRDIMHEAIRESHGREVQWIIRALPVVVADPAMLHRALYHLVENALKFTKDRKPAQIEISAEEEEHQIVIHVSDNGIGFAPHEASRIFGLFERVHAERDFPGLGIGLANVRRAIRRHGGQVRAHGEPGKGARFSVMLPRTTHQRVERFTVSEKA